MQINLLFSLFFSSLFFLGGGGGEGGGGGITYKYTLGAIPSSFVLFMFSSRHHEYYLERCLCFLGFDTRWATDSGQRIHVEISGCVTGTRVSEYVGGRPTDLEKFYMYSQLSS